ncbi:MAG: sugar phosphate isomerase/epimerase family protein [Gemmatimonadaceae bacterium]
MASTLRLAVSNIAWHPGEDDAIAGVLRREEIGGVEIAPTKWRDKPLDATANEIAAYRRAWSDRGLRIVSLQALLFGRPDLELFGSTRHELAVYLHRVVELGAGLGAHALVFGSPKNRLRGSLPMSEAMASATEFFLDVGDFAAEHGVSIAIEANPPEYGCDFVTRTREAVELCRAIASAGVGVNGDAGGITLSGDEPRATVAAARGCLSHFHASEPNLAELGAKSDHAAAAAGLLEIGYRGWVSVEMREAGSAEKTAARPANVAAVERAVRIAKQAYGSVVGA